MRVDPQQTGAAGSPHKHCEIRPLPAMDNTYPSRRSMDPSSSNSSRHNTPQKSSNCATPRTMPRDAASSLLQDRLREKKVERESNRPISGGNVAQSKNGVKGLGVKEMEETLSSLHKQNFDLKLELFHRRQRQTELEDRLEAAEKRVEDQEELQNINEQLLEELLKRDQAIEEAVAMICTLEEKVDQLMQDRAAVQSFDSQYDTDSTHGNNHRLSRLQIPGERDDGSSSHGQGSTKSVVKMPSFLSERTEGTEALRSLYIPAEYENHSVYSLAQLQEEDGDEPHGDPNSPRLSVLSESSFVSVYGQKKEPQAEADEQIPTTSDDVENDEETLAREKTHRKTEAVENWIDERSDKTQPDGFTTSGPRRPSPPHMRSNQFLSLNNVLESPLKRLEKLEQTLSKHHRRAVAAKTCPRPNGNRAAATRPEQQQKSSYSSSQQGSTSYNRQQLPPTPDTISTSTLRQYRTSDETLNQEDDDQKNSRFQQSESSFDDGHEGKYENTRKPPRRHNNSHDIVDLLRPRSACETVTSRREGHGWDTETQTSVAGYTETAVSDDNGEFVRSDPRLNFPTHHRRSRTLQTREPPAMFTFADVSDDEDADAKWGNNMLHIRERIERDSFLPAIKRSFPVRFTHDRQEPALLNRNSYLESTRARRQRFDPLETQSETTPNASEKNLKHISHARSASPNKHSAAYNEKAPIDSSPRPEPPDRCSSLGHLTSPGRRSRNGSCSKNYGSESSPFRETSVSAISQSRSQAALSTTASSVFTQITESEPIATGTITALRPTPPPRDSVRTRLTSKIYSLAHPNASPTRPMIHSQNRISTALPGLSPSLIPGKESSRRMSFRNNVFYADGMDLDGSSTPPPISRHAKHRELHDELSFVASKRPATSGSLDSLMPEAAVKFDSSTERSRAQGLGLLNMGSGGGGRRRSGTGVVGGGETAETAARTKKWFSLNGRIAGRK